MASNKTIPNTSYVDDFLLSIQTEQQQYDSLQLVELMKEVTGLEPVMWGKSIIGFGTYHYKYPSGREGDIMKVGFSPRKNALTLYGVIFYDEGIGLLDKLGSHSTGKGCLYIKTLADVDLGILRQMIATGFASKSEPK